MVFEERRVKVVGIGGTLRGGSSGLGALRRALRAAGEAGAGIELLDFRELNLPMYEPGGTLAGATKNALDVTRFLVRDERPYLESRVVGLISTAGAAP